MNPHQDGGGTLATVEYWAGSRTLNLMAMEKGPCTNGIELMTGTAPSFTITPFPSFGMTGHPGCVIEHPHPDILVANHVGFESYQGYHSCNSDSINRFNNEEILK